MFAQGGWNTAILSQLRDSLRGPSNKQLPLIVLAYLFIVIVFFFCFSIAFCRSNTLRAKTLTPNFKPRTCFKFGWKTTRIPHQRTCSILWKDFSYSTLLRIFFNQSGFIFTWKNEKKDNIQKKSKYKTQTKKKKEKKWNERKTKMNKKIKTINTNACYLFKVLVALNLVRSSPKRNSSVL